MQGSPELVRFSMWQNSGAFVTGGRAPIALLAVSQGPISAPGGQPHLLPRGPTVFGVNNGELPACPSLSYLKSLPPGRAQSLLRAHVIRSIEKGLTKN